MVAESLLYLERRPQCSQFVTKEGGMSVVFWYSQSQMICICTIQDPREAGPREDRCFKNARRGIVRRSGGLPSSFER